MAAWNTCVHLVALVFICLTVAGSLARSSCSSGYHLNPFSKTCIRVVSTAMTWYEAKDYCERAGEKLAVLDDMNSVSWLKHTRSSHPAWQRFRENLMWLGARKRFNIWQWQGRHTGLVQVADWLDNEPNDVDGAEDCIMMHRVKYGAKWNDAPCHNNYYFLCEAE